MESNEDLLLIMCKVDPESVLWGYDTYFSTSGYCGPE